VGEGGRGLATSEAASLAREQRMGLWESKTRVRRLVRGRGDLVVGSFGQTRGSPCRLEMELVVRRRLELIASSLGELPVLQARWLETTLGSGCSGETEMGSLV
jgi:hypothetical protein